MIVDDYMQVLGRGCVLIVQGNELKHMEIHCEEKIIRGDTTFTIKGVERFKYGDNWWSDRVGLVLSPNNLVPDCFEIGDKVEILKEE